MYYAIGLGILLGLWERVSLLQEWIAGVKIIPDPISTMLALGPLVSKGMYGVTLLEHVFTSFGRVLLGFLYAILLAVPLGLFLGLNKRGRLILEPVVDFIRPIPPIAWVPIAIILFGISIISHAFIIFIGAFFPLLQNVADGVRHVKPVYRDVAQSLGANRSQIIWRVVLPAIGPNILTGAKVSIGIGWMCVIAAEMIGVSDAGVGYFINDMKNIGNYTFMMAGMVALAIIGLAILFFFYALEHYAIKWVEGIK
ncbi:MAG: ABC transporter permease [Promethearchaeota archaeon CR_4]|nr:MAG: ABC transporter permease [Candidatus Lokiarchaeota archaeon CR_4]